MSKYLAKQGVIETDLGNEMVLLDPTNQKMFSLNEIGRLIWQRLPGEGLESVLEFIVQTYQVPPEEARADVLELIGHLEEAGLMVAE